MEEKTQNNKKKTTDKNQKRLRRGAAGSVNTSMLDIGDSQTCRRRRYTHCGVHPKITSLYRESGEEMSEHVQETEGG